MGMGMLFAGAMTGGAKAMGELADDAIKQRERADVRQQSIMDRRNELLFEMKAKADMARQEEEAAAGAFNRVAQRGAEIGNERGARELEAARNTVPREGEYANAPVTPGMLASMPPAARAIYEKEMGLTDDSTLQGLRDQVQASGEVAAPASVRKAVMDSYREEYKADKDAKDRDFKERKEAASQERADKRIETQLQIAAQRNETMLARISASASRGGGGGSDGGDPKKKPNTTLDIERAINATDAEIAKALNVPADRVPQALSTLSKSKSPDDVQKLEDIRRLQKSARDLAQQMRGMVLPEGGSEPTKPAEAQKPAAPRSTVKDNPTTKPSISSIQGAPSGASIGAFIGGKGWEVRSGGKLIGYAKD